MFNQTTADEQMAFQGAEDEKVRDSSRKLRKGGKVKAGRCVSLPKGAPFIQH